MNPRKRFYLRIDGVDGDDLGDNAHYLANHVFASISRKGLYDDLHGVVPVRNPEYDPRLPGPDEVTVDADALDAVLELADARLDDDLSTIRAGAEPESIGYRDHSPEDVNDAINELAKIVRDHADSGADS